MNAFRNTTSPRPTPVDPHPRWFAGLPWALIGLRGRYISLVQTDRFSLGFLDFINSHLALEMIEPDWSLRGLGSQWTLTLHLDETAILELAYAWQHAARHFFIRSGGPGAALEDKNPFDPDFALELNREPDHVSLTLTNPTLCLCRSGQCNPQLLIPDAFKLLLPVGSMDRLAREALCLSQGIDPGANSRAKLSQSADAPTE